MSAFTDAREDGRRLYKALQWLLHETMYKDHPEASQAALDALKKHEELFFFDALAPPR